MNGNHFSYSYKWKRYSFLLQFCFCISFRCLSVSLMRYSTNDFARNSFWWNSKTMWTRSTSEPTFVMNVHLRVPLLCKFEVSCGNVSGCIRIWTMYALVESSAHSTYVSFSVKVPWLQENVPLVKPVTPFKDKVSPARRKGNDESTFKRDRSDRQDEHEEFEVIKPQTPSKKMRLTERQKEKLIKTRFFYNLSVMKRNFAEAKLHLFCEFFCVKLIDMK